MRIKSLLIGIGVAIAVFVLLPFNSFNLIGTTGSGNVIKETREVSAFSGIDVGGAFNITLKKGDTQNLVIETDDNLMQLIKTKVKDGILVVSTKGNIKNSTTFNMYITVPHMNDIDLSGASKLISKDRFDEQNIEIETSGASNLKFKLKTNHMEIDASGASNIHINGFANSVEMEASGASNIKAFELEVNKADIDCSGASEVNLNVKESLIGEASGASNITYKGNPKSVNIETSGVGSVKRK